MPCRRALLLVPALAAIALQAGESVAIEAPGAATDLVAGGIVTVAGQGFVARRGDWLLTGEALRWDQRGDSLWASGGIVFVMPSVRLHAARIGLHPDARTGDAWDVEAWIEHGPVHVRVRAERVELRADRLTFHGVDSDFGHGGAMSLHCPTLHVYLREERRLDKGADQIDRYVEGIAAVRPTVELAGIPVLWFPYLYRDYYFDYPWSTVEAGESDRLGYFLRYRVGSNLPEMGGWRTRIEGRADRHTRAGNGGGLELFWKHPEYGRGGASVYRMYRERVADPADQSREGGERDADSWDLEHYASGRGWALAGRYTVLPAADPSQTLADGRSPDERFRADYQKRELETKPFARRGASAAWVTPWAAFTADVERRPQDDLDQTERLYGAEVAIPRLGLAGPVAVAGHVRAERLRQEVQDTEASRTAWEGRLGAVQWVGGLAFDATAGLRGVTWSEGRIAGSTLHGTSDLSLPFGEAGVRLRLVHDGADVAVPTLVLTPRLGVQVIGLGHGEGNPGFDFGDHVDDPEVDRQYLLTGLDGDLHTGPSSFHASVLARWGVRSTDREAVEVDGTQRRSDSDLADVTFKARGKPRANLELVADGTWDARLARWIDFDVRTRWQLAERVDLLYNGVYVPPTALAGDTWLHRIGGSLHLNRYRVDTWGEIRPGTEGRPGGRDVDLWHVGFTRRMVDGIATASYENILDPTQDGIEHRFAATFTFGGDQHAADDPVRGAFGF